MLLKIGACNEKICNLSIHKIESMQYFINEAMKCLCCILEAKEHSKKLKEFEGRG